MKITNDIKYIGVNDKIIDLFESQFKVPNGMAYNSYIILDEKIAVMDSVDFDFNNEWLKNLEKELNGNEPDYLIIHHMEPDHSSCILSFIEKYKNSKLVSSEKSFKILNNFYKNDFSDRQIIVDDGFKLSLGKHELTFFTAPMVHWPEVIVSYDNLDKVLFSADAFGKFGSSDVNEEWLSEARRYYFCIIGKYGVQVQSLLKKLEALNIKIICSLHGPVLNSNINFYLEKYKLWSNYKPEENGVFIAYTSVYDHTKKAVFELEMSLKEKGVKTVVSDLARSDMSKNIENAFKYNKLVLATTTYNGEIFPFMREFIHELIERNFSNRKVGFIENGSWMPTAKKRMLKMLENCKNIDFCENSVMILSSINDENIVEINKLTEELLEDFQS